MTPTNSGRADVAVATGIGPLHERFQEMLREIPASQKETMLALDELSLRLGSRMPDVAQTATYWQRGAVGRALRSAGYSVRVELGHVIFVRL